MNTLRYEWLSTDAHIYAIQCHKVLYTVLPVSSSAVITHVLSSNLELEKITSYIFLLLLHCNISLIRSMESSYVEIVPTNYNTILVFLPGIMHVYSGFSWDSDSFANLVLILSLSFILQSENLELFSDARSECKTLTRTIFHLCLGIFFATVAFYYALFLPFTQDIIYMASEEEQVPLLVSYIYFSVSVFVLLLTFHFKNRRKDSGQLFFGKVHDEIILILVIFSVIMIVCALSLPLELFFFISTFFVSLFVFVGTKMVSFNAEC